MNRREHFNSIKSNDSIKPKIGSIFKTSWPIQGATSSKTNNYTKTQMLFLNCIVEDFLRNQSRTFKILPKYCVSKHNIKFYMLIK
jgi:hypothetical protein